MRIDRLNSMEQYIIGQNSVSLEELATHFNISINTVRRDLNELLKKGHIQKVYGGVCASSQSPNLVALHIRNQLNPDAKSHIGQLASTLIPDGATIFLDSGSTTIHMIQHLENRQELSFITHSLPAMVKASAYPNFNSIFLGGVYNQSTASMFGLSVIDEVQKFSIGIAVMAATGVSIKNGLSNNTYMEAEIKRHVVENSAKIILLADHTKFGHDAMLSFCSLDQLSVVVTDCAPSDDYIKFFEKHNITLLY